MNLPQIYSSDFSVGKLPLISGVTHFQVASIRGTIRDGYEQSITKCQVASWL